jgi:hypothetical protein
LFFLLILARAIVTFYKLGRECWVEGMGEWQPTQR